MHETIKNLGWPVLRGLALALAFGCFAILGGCGPGVGGTGTGNAESTAAQLGASLEPVCASELAAVLSCPNAPATTASGTAVVWFADAAEGARVLVRVQGNQLDLDIACDGLHFEGLWAAVPGQSARFFGPALIAPASDSVPSTLTAERLGSGLVLQLYDAKGAALGALLNVVPVPGAPPPAACR